MKILELFSGYGTASFALKRLVEQRIIDSYECIGYSDIDKYANQCFRQNHFNEVKHEGYSNLVGPKELGDVKLIKPEELEDFDLLTGGFPCQAFSVAGKGLGELDPRGTLFYEIIRIAEVKKPRWMLLENVKGLTNKNHKPTFDKILSELDRIGYNVYWKVINSKDYGIPQNRERVFFVCFREKSDYDKFKFPEKEELKIFIKDILEEQVDEKYFLSELLQERFRKYLEDKENKLLLAPRNFNHKAGDGIKTRERYQTAISPSLQAQPGGTQQTYVLNCFENITRNGYETDMSKPEIGEANRIYGVNVISHPIKQSRINEENNVPMVIGKHQKDILQPLEGASSTITSTMYKQPPMVINTITTAVGQRGTSKEELGWIDTLRQLGKLRRLTPKECFRLMGFLNDEINLSNLSDTQCYKLAGNGQSVNVVEKIFKEMFK